jgi:hypothetical protein
MTTAAAYASPGLDWGGACLPAAGPGEQRFDGSPADTPAAMPQQTAGAVSGGMQANCS